MSTLPTFDTPELRDLETLIRERRTVGMYLPTPVPDSLIQRAIDISVWAPNHHVTEPWRFYLLGDATRAAAAELVRDIVTERRGPEAGEFKSKAWSKIPGMLAVTCQRSPDSELREREDYAACSAMLQNFALYLWRAGLGTKWTTGPITRDTRFFELLGANEAEEFVVGLMFYGYPKIIPEQKRAPLTELLVELP